MSARAAAARASGRWVEACPLAAIPRRGARVLRLGQGDVALFRTADDEVFALADRCPHRGGPLSQGIVHGRAVTCPLHDWTVALDTGRARPPDEGCTARHAVVVDQGTVWVAVDREPEEAQAAGDGG